MPLIGNIYSLAGEVWRWLVLAQGGGDKIMAGLGMARLLRMPEGLEESCAATKDFIREWLSNRAIKALIYICEAPYWKRT